MQNSKLQVKIQKFTKTIRYKLYAIRLQKGFTLIEMLIYMGLLSILLVVMVDLFAASLDAQLESQSISSVDRDGLFLISRITHDIQRSQSIVSPVLGSQNGTLELSIGGVSYTYTTNNGNLQLTNNNGIDNLNGFESTVSNLSFQTLGNTGGKHTVKVQFTIISKVTRVSGPETKNFQTTVGLR